MCFCSLNQCIGSVHCESENHVALLEAGTLQQKLGESHGVQSAPSVYLELENKQAISRIVAFSVVHLGIGNWGCSLLFSSEQRQCRVLQSLSIMHI